MQAHSDHALIGVSLCDRYLIERFSAEELLGRVYVARDQREGHLVHVKVLYAHLAGNPEKFARFGREFTATKMVRHPNTVQVTDWGQHADVYFLVFEYLICHTLQEELDTGPLPPIRAAKIAAQIAAAVGAAHEEGIVHRNLAPHNVLLLDNVASGVFVKVRDFGLSRLSEGQEGGGGNLTAAGSRLGNVAYMSPEYIEDEQVHPRGDVYAIGVLLFQMLTGRLPYEGRAGVVLSAHVIEPMPRPSSVKPGLPSWCDDVVDQLTDKDPSRRLGAYGVTTVLGVAVGPILLPAILLKLDADGNFKKPMKRPSNKILGAVAAVLASLVAIPVVAALAAGLMCWMSQSTRQISAPEMAAVAEEVVEEIEAASELEEAAVESPKAVPKAASKPATQPAATPSAPAQPVVEPAPPPVESSADTSSQIKVRANRRALVYIDGEPAGYTPLDKAVAPGEHIITASIPGRTDNQQSETRTVGRGGLEAVTFQF